MSGSDSKIPDSETRTNQAPTGSSITTKTDQESDPSKIPIEENGEKNELQDGEEGEEEEGECGFCLFMKGGGCKDQFIAWEDCIKEGEKSRENIVEKCFDVTRSLKLCMEAHADYYEPLLRAEKAAEEEAVREFQKEKAEEEEGTVVQDEAEKVKEGSKEE